MLIIKKFAKQWAPCSGSSIMILQERVAISLEWRHLVLTLLASIYDNEIAKQFFISVNSDIPDRYHNSNVINSATECNNLSII